MPVGFETRDLGWRKRRVGESADSDSDHVWCGGNVPVNSRPADRTEVIGGSAAVAGLVGDRLLAGKLPGRRLAFYFRMRSWEPPLHAEHGACPRLARIAMAQRDTLWVGAVVGNAEFSTTARSLSNLDGRILRFLLRFLGSNVVLPTANRK